MRLCSMLTAAYIVMFWLFGSYLATFFTDDETTLAEFSNIMPFLTVSLMVENAAAVMQGILAACGKQEVGARMYLLGTSRSCPLPHPLSLVDLRRFWYIGVDCVCVFFYCAVFVSAHVLLAYRRTSCWPTSFPLCCVGLVLAL